jgi:glycosyltransferase involved in cell wall biosynthesis
MIFIMDDYNNRAGTDALKLHMDFIQSLGNPIAFIIHSSNLEAFKRLYPNATLYSYKNWLHLVYQLYTLKAHRLSASTASASIATFMSKLFFKTEVYTWVQGIVPEESYLRHHSKIRYGILSLMEYLSLKLSTYTIFVSSYMQEYLEKKYRQKFLNAIVVPCISEFTYDGSPKKENSFVYIGGMSAWQRVDIMLEMFNAFAEHHSDATFTIATLEQSLAHTYIKNHLEQKHHDKVKVTSLTNRSQITHFLSTKTYGFLIREDIAVNHVSSPIKLAEYLSCGVSPIISQAVKSYAPLVESSGAGISLSKGESLNEKLKSFKPNANKALNLYNTLFSKIQLLQNYQRILK